MKKEHLEMLAQMPIKDFIQRLQIVNKDGQVQSLLLNAQQEVILDALIGGNDLLILKCRQIGSTTINIAYLFALAYLSLEPITFAIFSYKLSSSKHILKMAKAFYNGLPKALQREVEIDNSTELSFVGGGRIIAAATTQMGGIRSFTASKVLISEYAFAENAEELKASAFSACKGQIILESTANYYNDCLHQEIRKWETKQSQWQYIFFPWFAHQEYTVDREIEQLDEYEQSLVDDHDITLGQLAWRRLKVQQLGTVQFMREFPATQEEAYRVAGNTYFTFDDVKHIDVHLAEREFICFQEAERDDAYAIGVDVGGGTGRDYSVITVLSKKTNQPALIWRSNEVSPIQLADYIYEFSEQYNQALILVEANNYGLATINELVHQGCYKLYKDADGKDFLTTAKTKPLVFEHLKKSIQTGVIRTLDNITLAELRTIQTDERGRIKFLDSSKEGHSDSAMALALACWCLESVRLKQTAYLPDWIIANKAKRINDKTQQQYRRY
jgi:hypothetical protein